VIERQRLKTLVVEMKAGRQAAASSREVQRKSD
jgi:hypothetical protein